MTPALIGLVCTGLLIASFLRGSGSFHKLDTAVQKVVNPSDQDLVSTDAGPGGQAPIRLTRSATAIGKEVEFLSATLLPGRGMNVFQITAMIPGHGEMQLLASPAVETVSSQLNGKGEDTRGETSMTMGGAFLLPFAGRLSGTPGTAPGMLDTVWQGQLLHFPALAAGGTVSTDGLFLDRTSSSVKSDVLPDGQFAQAVFKQAFPEGWPSKVAVTVTVELSAKTLDLTVSATNKGTEPTPMGMGWHPMFEIPSGNRADASLLIPSKSIYAMDRSAGLPTGRIVNTGGAGMDFSRSGGTKLGSQDVDAVFTHLEADDVSPYPVAELLDPEYNLSVRVIPMSSNLTNLYVTAPSNKKWVSIGPASNAPDAFGAEWKGQDAGMVMLAPGATAEWKVRIEVSSIVKGEDRNR